MNANSSFLSQRKPLGKLWRCLMFGVATLAVAGIRPCACQVMSGKAMQVASGDFRNNQAIPKQFTADGKDVSPSITWSGAPQGTKSFAVICHDPDAPNKNWVHWVAYNIPASTTALPQGAGAPSGSSFKQGMNSFRKEGWNGPSP